MVAPYTGAWIEISTTASTCRRTFVAPYTGAWIEICTVGKTHPKMKSLPTRERGLKSAREEMQKDIDKGRSLHGSVD